MIREEILNAKLITTTLYSAALPLSLICLTAHQHWSWWWWLPLLLWFVDDGDATVAAAEFVKCLQSFARIMMKITVLTKCRQWSMRLVMFMVWQYCWWIIYLLVMYTKGRSCSYYCKDDDDDDDDVLNYGITTPDYYHNVGEDDDDGVLIMIYML